MKCVGFLKPNKSGFHLLLLAGAGQRFIHKLLFGKAQPPLAGSAVLGGEHAFAHALPRFLAQLLDVLAHLIWRNEDYIYIELYRLCCI